TIAVPIAVAITAMDMAMTTNTHITAMSTDSPIMVMDMSVARATETGRNTNLNPCPLDAAGSCTGLGCPLRVKKDFDLRSRHSRFTPNSGHLSVQLECPKSARSRHRAHVAS